MSWLLPSALAISGIAAAVAVALHFIARSRPVAEALPTARFIPLRPVHARSRSFALTDLPLLITRAAALLFVGAAVAGPLVFSTNGRVVRVIAVDRSRAVANPAEALDSARRLLREGDVEIAFDSSARGLAAESIGETSARGSLSAALVAAIRAAAGAASRADSIELVVISPFAAEELDEATSRIRATWPGRMHLVTIRGDSHRAPAPRVEWTGNSNDPVLAGLSLIAPAPIPVADAGNAALRVARARVSAADSVWAHDEGHVLVHWPQADSGTIWARRAVLDAVGGVSTSTGALVGRFPRLWVLAGTAVARWADGQPAAVEHPLGNGCIRDVGIILDPASDITLRAPFRAFAVSLLAPCGGTRRTERVSAASLSSLAGSGPLAPASALRDSMTSPFTPWLLVVAALLLLIELVLRRPARRAT